MIKILQWALWARDLNITVLSLSADYKVATIRYEDGVMKGKVDDAAVETLLDVNVVQPACWFVR